MSTSLKSTMKVEVAGAGTTTAHQTIEAEAYDKIEVTVPEGVVGTPATVNVQVQPGDAGQVQLLLITAATYADTRSLLSYSVDGGSGITLDAPQLFVGAGAVGLLGAVQAIEFSNEAAAVEVQILVGRDATPPP